MQRQLLLIFVKNPEAGKVKTRLAATIGADKALDIYKKLLLHTHQITSELNITKAVFYSDFVDNEDIWENSNYLKFIQHGNDLGKKMENAFKQGFDQRYSDICIIGSDCYQLRATHIKSAFDLLTHNEVVLGPSADGGYYLLGMNKLFSEFFNHKKWSTSEVLKDTLEDTQTLKIKHTLLETLIDVDEEKDLITMGLKF
ncbi:TIGR04282 family arsenosugar biosynthesis glycosyltransferase [soil metagenome]